MRIVIVYRHSRKSVECVWIRVEQVYCCLVGVGEDARTPGGGGLDAMQQLDMRRLLEVEQICVKAKILRSVCSIDCLRDGADCLDVRATQKARVLNLPSQVCP